MTFTKHPIKNEQAKKQKQKQNNKTTEKPILHFSPHTSRPTRILTLTWCSCFLPEEIKIIKSTSAASHQNIYLHTLPLSLLPGKNYLRLPKVTPPSLTSPHHLSTTEKSCSSRFSSPLDHFLCTYTVMFYISKYAHTFVISSILKKIPLSLTVLDYS